MTTLCLCEMNEHDLRVLAEIASTRRPTALAQASSARGWSREGGRLPLAAAGSLAAGAQASMAQPEAGA